MSRPVRDRACIGRLLAGSAAVMLAFAASTFAQAQPMPAGVQPHPNLNSVSLYEKFVGDADISQCNGRAYGKIVTAYDHWSSPIRIDTDNRSGGCLFKLAVIDPHDLLRGWGISLFFEPTGDPGQCGGIGAHDVQKVRFEGQITSSDTLRFDTDDRPGGCRLRFRVSGRGPALAIYFVADDTGSGQCGNPGVQVVQPGEEKSILIDTDQRYGGCVLQFRLR
jgi:hypothetical protein